jgi:hypothetical protein
MFSDPSSRPSRSHGARLPAMAIPHGVACRFRVFSVNRSSEDIGFFATSLRFGLGSPALSGIPSTPTLSGATQTVTPSCGFAPLQGFLPKVSPVTSRCGHLLQGFPGRSAYSFWRSPHTPEDPTLRVKVRIQGFSPSFRFAPPPASRVYVTPQPPFGFSLQGFPLPRSCTDSSPARCRLVVLQRLASRILVCGTSGAPSPQS